MNMRGDPWRFRNEIYALAVSAALVLTGFLFPEALGAKLLIAFVLLHASWVFGRQLTPTNGVRGYFLGAITLLASQSLFQTVAYYLGFHLGHVSDLLTLALSVILLQGLLFFLPKPEEETRSDFEQGEGIRWKDDLIPLILSVAGGGVLFFLLMRFAGSAATVDAIRTPWPLLPEGTFLAFALLPVSAWIAFRTKNGRLPGIALCVLTVLAVSFIAPLLYKLGYGFDGFLHQASERVLFETGTLQPKPLYYIGQYVFVTWLGRLSEFSLASLDRFLVPASVSMIVLAASLVFQKRKSIALLFLPLFLPLGAFVATTPQSFSYVLGLTAIGLSLATKSRKMSILPALFCGAWSLATHPLAGLPFLGAVILILTAQAKTEAKSLKILKGISLGLLVCLTSASVPIAFFANDALAGHASNWQRPSLHWQDIGGNILASLTPPLNHVALWADWAVYTEFFLPFLLVFLTVFAIWKGSERRLSWILLGLASVGLNAAAFSLKSIGDFSFLIDYERGNYADRLFLVALFMLLFPALEGAWILLKRINAETGAKALGIPLILALWFAGHAHAALPRHDAATASRGWSVGLADYEAVRVIEQDAADEPYTVLANQSVSAAAVDSFGFKRYVRDGATNEEIFYYPLPTGGRLYQLYLEAVAPEPSVDAIREAARLGQTNLLYVVVNAYWWDADHVSETLKQASEKELVIRNGAVKIYRFNVKQ